MKKIFLAFLLAAIAVGCEKKSSDYKGAESKTSNDFSLLEAKLREAERTVTELRIDTTRLNGDLDCLKAKLIANGLNSECAEAITLNAQNVVACEQKLNNANKALSRSRENETRLKTQIEKLQNECGEPKASATGSGKKLNDVPLNNNPERSSDYIKASIFDGLAENDGGFRFCTRVNGREDGYFPDFAIRKGMRIAGAENNNREGHNLVVYAPTEGFTNPEGGVTTGGIIYYPAGLIEKFLKVQYVDVLFSKNWTPIRMKKSGSWYVYETQQ